MTQERKSAYSDFKTKKDILKKDTSITQCKKDIADLQTKKTHLETQKKKLESEYQTKNNEIKNLETEIKNHKTLQDGTKSEITNKHNNKMLQTKPQN